MDDDAGVDTLVLNMVYAANRLVYRENRTSLLALCERIDLGSFYDYYMRNWDTCQDMWVMHLRAKLPHFRNHTNCLENFFGKLKDCLDGSTTMAKCVQQIIAWDRREKHEYTINALALDDS